MIETTFLYVVRKPDGKVTIELARTYFLNHVPSSSLFRIFDHEITSTDPEYEIKKGLRCLISFYRYVNEDFDVEALKKEAISDGWLVNSEPVKEKCKHRFVKKENDRKEIERRCKFCNMEAHSDGDFSYLCGRDYCKCCQ